MSTTVQLPLLPEAAEDRLSGIVNVASVPQRSPFRYPGGKTWLVPLFRRWMRSLPALPAILVEPFAGGGSIGLTAAFERLAQHILLVELDADVAAVWQTMLSSDAEWLAQRILAFPMSGVAVREVLSRQAVTPRERAFATLLRNRVYHGGILAPGSGLIKLGENGKGITSRWYPQTLARRIRDIAQVVGSLCFVQGDGIAVLAQYAGHQDLAAFIDPPYTASTKRAGSRLYTHSSIDHAALFACCARLQGDFLLTYDNAPEVREMAVSHGFDIHLVPMKNTHHAQMYELLIGRDLDWAR